MPRSTHQQAVLDFCLEHVESAPLSKRVFIYRGLAEFCGDDSLSREFLQLASDLESADRRCKECAFRFTLDSAEARGQSRFAFTQGGAK